MDRATILQQMKAHFEGTYQPEELEQFEQTRATQFLNESIDVVEFLVYLEDHLGPKVDATRVGPAMANMTFGELATELHRLLNEEPAA